MKKTVSRRNDFRPQTSERAPKSGALKNDKIPWKVKIKENTVNLVKKKKKKTFIIEMVTTIWVSVMKNGKWNGKISFTTSSLKSKKKYLIFWVNKDVHNFE